jgi:hypothetical protein
MGTPQGPSPQLSTPPSAPQNGMPMAVPVPNGNSGMFGGTPGLPQMGRPTQLPLQYFPQGNPAMNPMGPRAATGPELGAALRGIGPMGALRYRK